MTRREIKRYRKRLYREQLKAREAPCVPVVLNGKAFGAVGQSNFFEEIIADNFAGGGGASTGVELAASRPVAIAINHDPDAIAQHMANHPWTQHFQASVWDVDPKKVTRGQPVGLAWFSPDCKHFSKAKGAALVDRKIRGLAYFIADITLRMLTPRELYNAMGFPPDYIIDRDHMGNPYKKSKQVARCGNAVCPPLAEAMVRANLPEWCGKKYHTMAEWENGVAS